MASEETKEPEKGAEETVEETLEQEKDKILKAKKAKTETKTKVTTLAKVETKTEAKLETPLAIVVDDKEAELEDLELFRRFLEICKKPSDLRKNLEILLEPKNLNTTTIFDDPDETFSMLFMKVFAGHYPETFKSWGKVADIYMQLKISEKGIGREQAIKQIAALQESALIKSLLMTPKEPEKKRFGIFRRKDEE
jgi:hypothetical protein